MKGLLIRHKSRFIFAAILLAASIIAILAAWVRRLLGDTYSFPTFGWNLALAWVPFVVAFIVTTRSLPARAAPIALLVGGVIWLVFFPNAAYLLTDFEYLMTQRDNIYLWYDIAMLTWLAWTGLLLGLVSLYFMQAAVTRYLGRFLSWSFAVGSTFLGSLGIILGRLFRWNSWDIAESPFPIALDLWGWLKYPHANIRLYGFALLYSLLFLFIYICLHAFHGILQEAAADRS